jgi:hypothetical protein
MSIKWLKELNASFESGFWLNFILHICFTIDIYIYPGPISTIKDPISKVKKKLLIKKNGKKIIKNNSHLNFK